MSEQSINYQILSANLIKENNELKDELSNVTQELEGIYHMVDVTPNDQELGGMVREYYWEYTEEDEEEPVYVYESPDNGKTLYRRVIGETAKEKIEKLEPVSRERALARLDYLKSELAHRDYHDGWTIKGMEEEVEWIESQLGDGKQLELFEDK